MQQCGSLPYCVMPLSVLQYGTAQFKLDTRIYHTRVFAIDFCVQLASCLRTKRHANEMTRE